MPKIEVNENLFFSLLGRRCDAAELERIFPAAKAELDGWDPSEGPAGEAGGDKRTIKIELNDTNRPDLWSTAGVARQLRLWGGAPRPSYNFFSKSGQLKAANKKIHVEESVHDVRPFIAGFALKGPAVTDTVLKDMIQTQDKLAFNFGRKRKTVALGVYRCDRIKWPVAYRGVAPDSVSFVPLQSDRAMTLNEVLTQHPKGRDFGSLLAGKPLFPLLVDASGAVLSFPPIINSADLGAVKVGDTDLFVEVTGTDLYSVTLCANIVACDMSDLGCTVEPVQIDYDYDTPFGRTLVSPFYFQKPVSVEAGRVTKLLGRSFTVQQVADTVARMGSSVTIHGQYVSVDPPPYRNDFLHPVDIVEDVMIGCGMDAFKPERPKDFTIGRLSPIELFSRRAKGILVGLGYQEMIYNYLGSRKDYIEKMNISDSELVRISNPMSENYEFVRNSALPGLLGSESVSSKAAYPHLLFEVGKVLLKRPEENYGVATRQYLSLFSAHADADFNEMAGHIATLLYYLNREFSVAEPESDDSRFISGRQACIIYKGRPVGIYGELNPKVLEAFSITMPAAAAELDLDSLLD